MNAPGYPHTNLFFSSVWSVRTTEVFGTLNPFQTEIKTGIRVAYRRHHALTDFEKWPCPTDLELLNDDKPKSDLVFFRKLLAEGRPTELSRSMKNAWIWPCTVSPYLDLTQNLNADAHAMANIRRRARNLTKERGAYALTLMPEHQLEAWFGRFLEMQTSSKENSIFANKKSGSDLTATFRKWLGPPHPAWMKLFSFSVGDEILAQAICYLWEGVFYYHLPTTTSDPDLRKFGVGKIFVQELIDWALAQGAHTFDFLQGDEAYKFDWKPALRTLYQCEIPLTAAGTWAIRARKLKRAIRMRGMHD